MPRLGHFGKVGLPGPLGLSALRHLLLIFDLIAGDQFNPTVNHKIKKLHQKMPICMPKNVSILTA